MASEKFAVWYVAHRDDALFDPIRENPENRFAPFIALKQTLNERGIECHTYDVYVRQGRRPDSVLFLDIPRLPLASILGRDHASIRKSVFVMENRMIVPRNWDRRRHGPYDKVFMGRRHMCDGEKYVWVNFCFDLTRRVHRQVSRPRLCVIIARNRRAVGTGELYSKRIEAIHWFEKNHPDDLDFYGLGWELYAFWKPRPLRHLNRLPFLRPIRRWMAEPFPSWKGPVDDKLDVMRDYKFAICYENLANEQGYVTEKLFDCFFAGCIPIYLGAPDIADLVPADCFIDAREFVGWEDMYRRISTMSDDEREGYIERIAAFLKSEQAQDFSAERFAETISAHLFGRVPAATAHAH